MSTLELRGATKHYKKDTVVDDVSFTVASGETLVLFGPSGAGKTVLLRMIAGVVEPDNGAVFIDGADMASPLTVGRNSKEVIKAGVEKVAKLLKIEHVLTHTPRELSNGQKQRTALARALAATPPLLLLDDPLRNVDAKLRFEMRLELPNSRHSPFVRRPGHQFI